MLGPCKVSIAEQFVTSPDLSMQPTRVHVGEDHFVAELTMSGTRDGKEFSCDAVDVISVKDGLVARKDAYADWAGRRSADRRQQPRHWRPRRG